MFLAKALANNARAFRLTVDASRRLIAIYYSYYLLSTFAAKLKFYRTFVVWYAYIYKRAEVRPRITRNLFLLSEPGFRTSFHLARTN